MVKQIAIIVTLLVAFGLIFAIVAAYMASKIKIHTSYAINELDFTPIVDERYRLINNYIVNIDGNLLMIPKGFETDLASVPRVLWGIYPPNKFEYTSPAIVHDYLYACHNGYTRKEADDIFYSLLTEYGVSNYTALKFYMVVRFFGMRYFDDKKCIFKG